MPIVVTTTCEHCGVTISDETEVIMECFALDEEALEHECPIHDKKNANAELFLDGVDDKLAFCRPCFKLFKDSFIHPQL